MALLPFFGFTVEKRQRSRCRTSGIGTYCRCRKNSTSTWCWCRCRFFRCQVLFIADAAFRHRFRQRHLAPLETGEPYYGGNRLPWRNLGQPVYKPQIPSCPLVEMVWPFYPCVEPLRKKKSRHWPPPLSSRIREALSPLALLSPQILELVQEVGLVLILQEVEERGFSLVRRHVELPSLVDLVFQSAEEGVRGCVRG